jgi:hypothetical protein
MYRFPHRVILLRNSMDSTESRIYGLYEALRDRYAYMPIYKAGLKANIYLQVSGNT